MSAVRLLLARLAGELGLPQRLDDAAASAPPVPLPSHLAAGDLAWTCVAVTGATLFPDGFASPDPLRVAASYRSDRHLLVDGAAPETWSPLSRFWRSSDGWVRTHGNYAHHAAALRRGLSLGDDAEVDEIAERFLAMGADAASTAIRTARGVCVRVREEQPDADAALRRHPLIGFERLGDAPTTPLPQPSAAAPLAGIRVLDLTRVIAGPVATRALAQAGADVLRIDPPWLPEPEWQHLDTGHGKRSALLDVAAQRETLETLLTAADAVVLGYRPSGLRRLGLDPRALITRHPRLIVGQLSAWLGEGSPRGFDSIVQADSGISWIEAAGGDAPGALPAQALDHSAGHLLAAGVAMALRRRAASGGAWLVRTSLRRVAAELLGMPRPQPTAAEPAPERVETREYQVGGRRVTTVAPAVVWPGSPDALPAPRPWGGDAPQW